MTFTVNTKTDPDFAPTRRKRREVEPAEPAVTAADLALATDQVRREVAALKELMLEAVAQVVGPLMAKVEALEQKERKHGAARKN